MTEEKKESKEPVKVEKNPNKKYSVVNAGVGAKRRLVIETDGSNVHIPEMSMSPIEVCEIARRLIKRFGGL